MTDTDTKDAPPPLESIPGRARIVDAEGNPYPPTEDTPLATKTEAEPSEPEDEEGEGRHARSVRRRHSRSTE